MTFTCLHSLRPARDNGWTPRRKRIFFNTIAAGGTVAMACARAGLSRAAAYKARHRDAEFALAWRQALDCAQDAAERALLDGMPEHLRWLLRDADAITQPEERRVFAQDTVNSVNAMST